MNFIRSSIAMLVLFSAWVAASAQPSYPEQPIRLVVPFPPGGPADLIARVISEKMSAQFGQPVVVDNKPGANTIIAAEFVARAPADGYTLLLAIDSTIAMNPHLYSKLRYDPLKDFTPVSLVATLPGVVVVQNSFPANTLRELIDIAKARPGDVSFGAGTVNTQLAGELLNAMAGIKMQYVPYKGGGTTIMAVLSGEVPMIIDGPNTALPYWKAGKVKVLAVTSPKRLSQAPTIPTVAESGVPGYEVSIWQSVVAPAGTPKEIISKLNAEIGRILALPDVKEKLATAGIEPAHNTPEQMAAYARDESAKWGKLIREKGLKVD
jgi:tripartite-type tricarboxylate transporter receptor subunit TctC